MKITTFNPLILSTKADDVIKLFEELGFEPNHAPVIPLETGDVTDTRLKDENGHSIDVANPEQLPQDTTAIRINVDNFAEAFDILEKHGFKNTRKDRVVVAETARAATMVSPSGLTIVLVKHVKKD